GPVRGAVPVLVVVVVSGAVGVDAVVPGVGSARVHARGGVVAVVRDERAVAVLIVVPAIVVLIDAAVPDLGRRRVDRRVVVVAVVTAALLAAVAVRVGVLLGPRRDRDGDAPGAGRVGDDEIDRVIAPGDRREGDRQGRVRARRRRGVGEQQRVARQ